jgi:hypothetical protein
MFEFRRLLKGVAFDRTAEFQRFLQWKLLRGSHQFPGPDGGTCINEAAIVAAGYVYRPVYSVKDLPASFSRPLAMFALCINDTVGDELRQDLLLPFVTRLDGSADSPEVEMRRAKLILERTVSEILLPLLVGSGNEELANRQQGKGMKLDLIAIASCLRKCKDRALGQCLTAAFEHASNASAQSRFGQPGEVAFCAFLAIRAIALREGADRAERVYRRATAILKQAFDVGRQAESEGMGVAASRMQRAKRASERGTGGELIAA